MTHDRIELVEVPEESFRHEIIADYSDECEYGINYCLKDEFDWHNKPMPELTKDNYVLLGTFQNGEIDFEVPKDLICSCHYLDEYNDTNICRGCGKIQSIRTLLHSLSVPNKRYVVLLVKK